MKKLFLFFLVVTAVFFSSCEKGATGAQGIQGNPGPEAKTFNFNLTFNAGSTWALYTGITGYDADDVVLTYAEYETVGGEPYWASTPVIVNGINYIPDFSDVTGKLYVNTLKADGSAGSPWGSAATIKFRAVLIKSAQKPIMEGIDVNNYAAVRETFNLEG